VLSQIPRSIDICPTSALSHTLVPCSISRPRNQSHSPFGVLPRAFSGDHDQLRCYEGGGVLVKLFRRFKGIARYTSFDLKFEGGGAEKKLVSSVLDKWPRRTMNARLKSKLLLMVNGQPKSVTE